MKLPAWLLKWLGAYNVNAEAFKAFLESIADKADLPEDWRREVALWLDANATISPEIVIAFVTLVYAEFRSGAPGWNKQHGGLA